MVVPLNLLIDDQISYLEKDEFKAAILWQRDVKSGGHSSIQKTLSIQDRIVECAINEAHYSKLCRLASLFPSAPILALTATAPKKKRFAC